MSSIKEYEPRERSVWNRFDWDINGQRVTGLLKEFETKESYRKVGVAVEIPASAENVQISMIVRRKNDRGDKATLITKDEECFLVSYWDSILKSGRLIIFPRELVRWDTVTQTTFWTQIEDFQVFAQGGEKSLH